MSLETGTHIGALVQLNPTSDDYVREGDDHFRLLKEALLTDFQKEHSILNTSDGGVHKFPQKTITERDALTKTDLAGRLIFNKDTLNLDILSPDASTWWPVSGQGRYGVSNNTANVITVAMVPATPSLTVRQLLFTTVPGGLTGAVFINIDGLGAKPLVAPWSNSSATYQLQASDLVPGQVFGFAYNETLNGALGAFMILTPWSSSQFTGRSEQRNDFRLIRKSGDATRLSLKPITGNAISIHDGVSYTLRSFSSTEVAAAETAFSGAGKAANSVWAVEVQWAAAASSPTFRLTSVTIGAGVSPSVTTDSLGYTYLTASGLGWRLLGFAKLHPTAANEWGDSLTYRYVRSWNNRDTITLANQTIPGNEITLTGSGLPSIIISDDGAWPVPVETDSNRVNVLALPGDSINGIAFGTLRRTGDYTYAFRGGLFSVYNNATSMGGAVSELTATTNTAVSLGVLASNVVNVVDVLGLFPSIARDSALGGTTGNLIIRSSSIQVQIN